MNSHHLPLPYSMCSKEECVDRERFGEVSVFECHHDDSRTVAPNKRLIDPCRAVSKYRRSAAGSSVEDRYPVRTVDQLATTVEHVLRILAEQRSPPTTDGNGFPQNDQQRETMRATVSFVEDRLRAVQVDLVKLRHPLSSRHLQLRMARAHIVILYVMADCKAYKAAFGANSLQTALASYFLASPPATDSDPDAVETDEVLSYVLLFALRQDMLEAAHAADGGLLDARLSSVSASLAAHRHRFQARLRPRRDDPSLSGSLSTTLQWTMRLLSHVIAGHWHMALRHLGSRQAASHDGQLHDAFVTLVRCLLAPCLPHMRLEALKCYNASFGKGEAVPASRVAYMVQMPRSAQEVEGDGVAVNGKSTWDDVPEEPTAQSGASEGRRSAANAALRFGQEVGLPVGADDTLLFKVASSSPLRLRLDRSVRNDEDFLVLGGRECENDAVELGCRTDSDGVRIPPPSWMRRHTA